MPPFRRLLAGVRIRLEEMSIRQNMHFQSELLIVDASGEFSLEDAKQAFLEMLEAVAQHKAEKILFDAREVKGRPEDLERFYYGEFAARETHRETVAVNRGMNVKTFETPEDAIEWLTNARSDDY